MTNALAETLYRIGRAHAGAACLLYAVAVGNAVGEGLDDAVGHVFNGQNSLSIMRLLGLGLELMLKAAVVEADPDANEKFLRDEIGHDLLKAIAEAEKRGFISTAPHLNDVAALLHDPYRKHWFRYGRTDEFAFPTTTMPIMSPSTAPRSPMPAVPSRSISRGPGSVSTIGTTSLADPTSGKGGRAWNGR